VADFLNLDPYLARIEHSGNVAATLPVLRDLHLAHATHIPFENIDVLLGRSISLDIPSLETKLVTNHRGGYCFEQNTLFAAVLEQIGFSVTRLGARVRLGSSRIAPRTHMLLLVQIENKSFLADVGFGGGGFIEPIVLEANQTFEQYDWLHRLRKEKETEDWVLQTQQEGEWIDQYAFSLEPHYPADYEVANYYTSTFPTSHFRQILIAQAMTREDRYALHNSKLIEARGSASQSARTLAPKEIPLVLAEKFGLRLPPGTHIPIQVEIV
jgi:N-hydroxyarylamine O-acetyltransferase